MGIIYKGENKLNKKVYIGQTWRVLSKRICSHYEKNNCNYFYNALRKYGLENFEWEVLFQSEIQKDLDEKEKFFIKKYKSNRNEFGYNLQEGGRGGKPNEITRKKMSESAKKYFSNKQNKERHGEIQKKRFENFDERIKHSKAHGGRPFYGRNKNELKLFQTQVQSAQYIGSNQSSISSALLGKSKIINGWIFSYNYIEKYINNKIFFAEKGNEKYEFDSPLKAKEFLVLPFAQNICSVLKGKKKSYKGWKFYYKNGE